MHKNIPPRKRDSGEFIAELPVVLTVLLLLLMVPMINLASSVYRAYVIRTSCLEAVRQGARCDTYMNDIPPDATIGEKGARSCKNKIDDVLKVYEQGAGLAGRVDRATGRLVVIREDRQGQVQEFTAPLSVQDITPDTATYFYEYRADATANPIFPMNVSWVPNVPGLTGPMPLKIAARQVVEKPNGLVQ
jgi:hypothetical protein